jgi:hypothetical protein
MRVTPSECLDATEFALEGDPERDGRPPPAALLLLPEWWAGRYERLVAEGRPHVEPLLKLTNSFSGRGQACSQSSADALLTLTGEPSALVRAVFGCASKRQAPPP